MPSGFFSHFTKAIWKNTKAICKYTEKNQVIKIQFPQ